MSAEAIAYVSTLLQCPDGAELTCTQKCILFCLADHHNRSTNRCFPSQELLIAESLTSKDTVQRAIAYLQVHGVIQRSHPTNQGRGRVCAYRFPDLDRRHQIRPNEGGSLEGEHRAPLFTNRKGEQKGSNGTPKGEQKGSIDYNRYKEGTCNHINQGTGGARARAREAALSQPERDTLDLKRFQLEMAKLERSADAFKALSDAEIAQRTKLAAYKAGIAPARLVQLLKQHFPNDLTLDELYPNLHAPQPNAK